MPRTKKKPEIEIPPAPEHLSVRGRLLWGALAPTAARSVERQTLLQAALEALDRADAAREQVEREGPTFVTATTGAVHVHPMLKVEKEARMQFVRIWDLLNLRSNDERSAQ
ncbi:MAG: hypothetical protein IPM24_03860 [Bryobacterales bacterium]|nr:hypothetical protein [Bryobacterales bacterium]